MYIETLSVQNFRNFTNLKISLSQGVNIFCGENAQGKTNVLESIYFCATGRSQRTHIDKELIQFNQNFAHIQTIVNRENTYDKIDLHLKKDAKKGIAVNGVPVKKLGELFGVLLVVIFSPEDLYLVKSGPAERRKYIDLELCQLSSIYYYELQNYYKILKQRNNLLKNIQKNKSLLDSLFVWDTQLVEHGIKIIAHREEFIKRLSSVAENLHDKITCGKEKLQIFYRPSVVAAEFSKRLNKYIERDIFQGSTSIGIHKDDFSFFINGIDAKTYGSQGQQRTASLSTKLAQIEIIKEEKDEYPILLLDDVLSELDESRQRYLIENTFFIQTIITCTDAYDVLKIFKDSVSIYRVENGEVFLSESK